MRQGAWADEEAAAAAAAPLPGGGGGEHEHVLERSRAAACRTVLGAVRALLLALTAAPAPGGPGGVGTAAPVSLVRRLRLRELSALLCE
jgi:hypothetical protein